jgi:hypothetical protein
MYVITQRIAPCQVTPETPLVFIKEKKITCVEKTGYCILAAQYPVCACYLFFLLLTLHILPHRRDLTWMLLKKSVFGSRYFSLWECGLFI